MKFPSTSQEAMALVLHYYLYVRCVCNLSIACLRFQSDDVFRIEKFVCVVLLWSMVNFKLVSTILATFLFRYIKNFEKDKLCYRFVDIHLRIVSYMNSTSFTKNVYLSSTAKSRLKCQLSQLIQLRRLIGKV